MYCANCGKMLLEKANYCMYCGEKIIYPKDYSAPVKMSEPIEVEPPRDTKPIKIDLDVLEERLKEYRKAMANIENVPPFQIFTNKSLKSILIVLPTSIEDCYKIHGFGNMKTAKYGKDITEIINTLDMNNINKD